MSQFKAILFVLLGASSYGILSTFVKLAYIEGFTVGSVSGSQMFIGVILLWILTFLFKKVEKLHIKIWLPLFLIGSFSGLTGIFYYNSLLQIPASIAVILLFQFTWIGVLGEAILRRKRLTFIKILSLFFLFFGTLLSSSFHFSLIQGSFSGYVFGFLSAVTYAGFIYFSGSVGIQANPWMRSSIISTGAVFTVFLTYPPTFIVNGDLLKGLLLWGVLLAIFGVLFPTVLFTYGVPRIGNGLASILGAVELPTAVLMSWIILGENVFLTQWLGVFIILLGITVPYINQKSRMKQEV